MLKIRKEQLVVLSSSSLDGKTNEDCPYSGKYTLVLLPRKYTNIFNSEKKVKDIITSYPSSIPKSPIKKLEGNFYPDLNCSRTVTAILTDIAWCPHYDECPEMKKDKNVIIRFSISCESPDDFSLSPQEMSMENGWAETTIKVLKLYDKKEYITTQHILIKAYVNSDPNCCNELELTIHRNEDVEDDLVAVLKKETILVQQNNNHVESAGVIKLQELLNQVVSRHKDSEKFSFLPVDGKYDSHEAQNVAEFINHFAGGPCYPEGKFDVKVDNSLVEYVKAEYDKKDDNIKSGILVDSCLLMGPQKYDPNYFEITPTKQYDKADGLYDIYLSIVKTFFTEMEERAKDYTERFKTFWLHRPSDKPYKESDDIVLITNKNLIVKDRPNGKEIEKGLVTKGTRVKISRPQSYIKKWHELFTRVFYPDWYEISTLKPEPIITGWCNILDIMTVGNDISNDNNWGNFGIPGVAYSWGGKDTPETFKESLKNSGKFANAQKNNPKVVVSWYQYERKPGQGSNQRTGWRGHGCDCSGFVFNCIISAIFPNTRQRISTLLGTNNTNDIGSVGSERFISEFAREIRYSEMKNEQLIDKTDLIVSYHREGVSPFKAKHIVWVADKQSDKSDKNFCVYNAYGKDFYFNYDGFGENREGGGTYPKDRYARKVQKMPFKYWGIQFHIGDSYKGGTRKTKIGRIYFWSSLTKK